MIAIVRVAIAAAIGLHATSAVGENDASSPPDIVIKPGGYVQVLGKGYLEGDGVQEFTLPRVRPKVDGTALEHFPFRLQVDFAGSKLVLLDAWVEVRYVDWLVLRAGKDKVQFGLERLNSDSTLTFITRALPTQLVPDRDIGVQLRGDLADGTLHYAAAIFNGAPDVTSVDGQLDDHPDVNARVFVRPFARAGVSALAKLGLGGAITWANVAGSTSAPVLTAGYRTAGGATFFRWESSTSDPTLTAFADGRRRRVTGQASYYYGRVGALAEYVRAAHAVSNGVGGHANAANTAWQVAASVLLTADEATDKGVTPTCPFDPWTGGSGAVELAARYAELRIDADAFDAGLADPTSAQRARAFTAGINWYLNRMFKLQVDVERTTFRGGAIAAETVVLAQLQLQL